MACIPAACGFCCWFLEHATVAAKAPDAHSANNLRNFMTGHCTPKIDFLSDEAALHEFKGDCRTAWTNLLSNHLSENFFHDLRRYGRRRFGKIPHRVVLDHIRADNVSLNRVQICDRLAH